MKHNLIIIWHRIIGKCQACNKWFCYKEKYIGTHYVEQHKNYARLCEVCHEEISKDIHQQLVDLHL